LGPPLRFAFLLAFSLTAAHAVEAAGPPTIRQVPRSPADVFGMTKVWSMHLTVQPADWKKMHPTRGGFTPGAPAKSTTDRKPRGGFGYDFEYVHAALEMDGTVFKDVAVRFKGNSTYATTSSILRRPFKIDLDRYVEGQGWAGLKKLVLNNNVMDSSASRETLSYAIYRAAGVPAPRTAFVRLRLTVPGPYDCEVVGLYTLIEAVDKDFLKTQFGNAKGMLLKPERVGPLDYLGEQWSAYESRYRPKTTATPKAQRRLIELTRLIHLADDARFHKEIGTLLDVDRFTRYLAATVLLSSLDSFSGIGHNYYLYLDPKTNRFVILPWDLDHSFGALLMFSSASELVELSIRRPWAGQNALVERLLRDEKVFAAYRGHLERLLNTVFTAEGVKKDAAAIRAVVASIKEEENAPRRSERTTCRSGHWA